MKVLVKVAIGAFLLWLAYTTGVHLPVQGAAWGQVTLNNFAWVSLFVYFVIYLPMRGYGISNRNWPFKIVLALVAVAMVMSLFTQVRDARVRGAVSTQKAGSGTTP